MKRPLKPKGIVEVNNVVLCQQQSDFYFNFVLSILTNFQLHNKIFCLTNNATTTGPKFIGNLSTFI